MQNDSLRPDEEFSSHKWPSTSAWSAKELYLLHVDLVEVEDIFEGMVTSCDEVKLTSIYDTIPYSSKEYEDRATIDSDFVTSHIKRFGNVPEFFYDAIADVVLSVNNRTEESSPLHVPVEQLSTYLQSIGSAMPHSSMESGSGESTSGQAGSPVLPNAKKVTWDNSIHIEPAEKANKAASDQLTDLPRPIVKSTSDSSNLSLEMGTKEDQSETALFHLLHLILAVSRNQSIRCHQSKQTYPIMFGLDRAASSTNDGSIVLGRRLHHTNTVPLVNIECKSRKASSGTVAKIKIAAQEFGESLAIMQERMRVSRYDVRSPSVYTVFTVGMHGRRAYLVRIDFKPAYLHGIDCQNLGDQRMTMRRTKQAFRLDEKSELHAFVRIVFTLFCHLSMQVEAGRRV